MTVREPTPDYRLREQTLIDANLEPLIFSQSFRSSLCLRCSDIKTNFTFYKNCKYFAKKLLLPFRTALAIFVLWVYLDQNQFFKDIFQNIILRILDCTNCERFIKVDCTLLYVAEFMQKHLYIFFYSFLYIKYVNVSISFAGGSSSVRKRMRNGHKFALLI